MALHPRETSPREPLAQRGTRSAPPPRTQPRAPPRNPHPTPVVLSAHPLTEAPAFPPATHHPTARPRPTTTATTGHIGRSIATPSAPVTTSAEITFQLKGAQFSVIALAAPGSPSVVIDRIAYTPYGEPTRRLRSDVDGNGVVDGGDYGDVIQQLIGTPITSPTYRVEADLDRNGAITLADYDVCITDDGRKILGGGGVGETDLFSPGVRNSVGYCGYIHNEDTGLYTVRFRTYSPTLGRWLTRDPDGTAQNRLPVSVVRKSSIGAMTQYTDGPNLFQYCISDPMSFTDYLGLQASLCNPNAMQALLASYEAMGLTAAQIARLLALRGVAAKRIAELIPSWSIGLAATTVAAIEAEKQGLVQAITDKVRGAIKQMAKEAACKYGQGRKTAECKGANEPKSCEEKGWDPTTGKKCEKFERRMEHFARCAVYRQIEAEFCEGSKEWKEGHLIKAGQLLGGALKCAQQLLLCKASANKQDQGCEPCKDNSAGGPTAGPPTK